MAFTHQRLPKDQIRLLRPISFRSQILEFELSHFPRDIARAYTAVSYTWGEDEATEVIYLNGEEFKVRANLWSCLYYLRADSMSTMCKHIWIDAICIDQKNTLERNEQVRLMDRTYKEADYVSVWLGLAPGVEQYQSLWPERIKMFERDRFDWFTSIEELTSRPYWSRFWVIQECLLGRQVQLCCSDSRMEWSTFQDILYHTTGIEPYSDGFEESMRKAATAPNTALPLVMGRHVDGHPHMQQPLHELLIRYHRSECKDPRDRVFALLGLVAEEERVYLSRHFPDYFLSEERVMIITLAHMMFFCQHEIAVGSEEVVLGLGIKSKAQQKRLLSRARNLDYLGNVLQSDDSDTEAQEQDLEQGLEQGLEDEPNNGAGRSWLEAQEQGSEDEPDNGAGRSWLKSLLTWGLVVSFIVIANYSSRCLLPAAMA